MNMKVIKTCEVLAVTGIAVFAANGEGCQLTGKVGEYANSCIAARAYSAWARGAMYEEAVEAFRTHYDDSEGRCGWQNEYWGKTMLSFAGAARYTGDAELKQWIQTKTVAFLKEFQHPNGYLSTYAQEDFLDINPAKPKQNRIWCFNIWGQKYTMWALIDIYRATGDEDALKGAVKMLDHLIAQLKRLGKTIDKTGSWNGVSSMSILRPVLELYRIEKKPEYLEFARGMVAAMQQPDGGPGALLANAKKTSPIKDWFPEPGYWAKVYEILSCLEGVVDYYRLTGDRAALEGVLAFYDHIEKEELNAVGSAGHFDHFFGGGVQMNAMTELCDVVHWIRLNQALYEATGEAKYADRLETAFFNAFLAGVTRDGRWGAHVIKSHGSRHCWAPPQTGMFHHQCCPDNMMRSYFDYAAICSRIAADGAIEVVMYSDSEVDYDEDRVTISGGYPWSRGNVNVNIDLKAARKVRFRIPAWSQTTTLNGEAIVAKAGWCEVAANAGHSIYTLGFDFSPRVVAPTIRWPKSLPPSPQRNSLTDIGIYTVKNMEWTCPEMTGMCLNLSAFRVLTGPLILAKARMAGETKERTYAYFSNENGHDGWQATIDKLAPTVENAAVSQAWALTLERGIEKQIYKVTDFAEASNIDDHANWFSIWF